jgi:hypothetical protein
VLAYDLRLIASQLVVSGDESPGSGLNLYNIKKYIFLKEY